MLQRVIGIISGKGGVGKTTCTINLCAALTEMKRDVIAIDADIKMSGLGLQLGMYNFRSTLNDLLNGEGNIYEAIHTHESGLKIIPSSLSVVNSNFLDLKDIFHHPYLHSSLVIVDSPPGFEKNSIEIMGACTETIVVTTPEIPSIVNAMKMLRMSMELGARPIGIIVNMYDKGDPNQIDPKDIESVCEIPVIGVVPYDKSVKKSIFKRTPTVFMSPYSNASVEFKKIAARVGGYDYKQEKLLPLKRLIWGFKK